MLSVGGMVIMALGALYGLTMLNECMTKLSVNSGAFNSNPSSTDGGPSFGNDGEEVDFDLDDVPDIAGDLNDHTVRGLIYNPRTGFYEESFDGGR